MLELCDQEIDKHDNSVTLIKSWAVYFIKNDKDPTTFWDDGP